MIFVHLKVYNLHSYLRNLCILDNAGKLYFVGATGATFCKKDVVQMHSTTRAFAALQADGKVVTWGAAGEVELMWL